MADMSLTTPGEEITPLSSVLLSNASNVTNSSTSPEETVHDKGYNMEIRKATLYLQIVVGIFGAMLVFAYMIHSRRQSSR